MTLKPLRRSIMVRHWTRADIDYVHESVSREGWGHTQRDVERCWKLEPKGCFIAEFQGKPVGHVFSICYGKIGWIGLLIVNLDRRGQGVGLILMETAVNSLKKVGAETIRLEAVQEAVPLYRRVGFVEEFDSLRFRRQPHQRKEPQVKRGKTFQMRDDDLAIVAQFDAPNFGADRLTVLQSLYRDNQRLCFVAKDGGKLVGYVMARQTQNGFWIGPWICLNSATARYLFYTLAKTIGSDVSEVRVGLPALNTSGRGLMEKLGFELTGKSIHMVLGRRENHSAVRHVYGIGGPEKG